MAGSALSRGTIRVARTTAMLIAAWVVAHFVGGRFYDPLVRDWCQDAINRIFAGFPTLAYFVDRVFSKSVDVAGASYVVALFFATIGIPLGYVSRMVARARVRAGNGDPLDRVRDWVKAHPWLLRGLLAVPALGWTWAAYRGVHWGHAPSDQVTSFLAASFGGAAQWFLMRSGLRLFLEPTIDGDAASTMTISDDEIVFDAVAVTGETVGAIVFMALLPIAFVTWAVSVRLTKLYTDANVFQVMAAYVAVALGGALWFKQASRTAVGIDGVRVYGTSRTRFFAYRDLDEARFTKGDLELVRGGRVLIKLQLHGEDAARRDAVLARITAHITNARDPGAQGARRFVEAKSTEEVARVALGGGDYRAPSITREALWQLVEGPTTDASSRRSAAEALVRAIPPEEIPRLRVAADKCADVKVRVALQRIADAVPLEGDAAPAGGRAQRA